MKVIDYNGSGAWAQDAICERYARYRGLLRLPRHELLTTRYAPGGERAWVYPLMGRIVDAIRKGDPAAVMIGIEFIEEDTSFPFGMALKSDVARALRQHAVLDDLQTERLRRRFAGMLLRGYLPREYKEYAKLFRKIGLGGHREAIEKKADQSNPFVRRWRWYLLQDHESKRPSKYLRPW